MTIKLKLMVSFALLLMSINVFAAPIKITSLSLKDAAIDVDRVSNATILSMDSNKDITVRLVVLDNNGSTDVSPGKRLLITYFHKGEQTNVHTAFDLGSFYEVKKIKPSGKNIHMIQVEDYVTIGDGSKMKTVNLTIDTSQVFIDDKNLKLQEFDDRHFESSIKVTRKLGN